MKLNSASDYKFVTPAPIAFEDGPVKFEGNIMPLRNSEGAQLVSYEDICFLEEAVGELHALLVFFGGGFIYGPYGQIVKGLIFGPLLGIISFDKDAPVRQYTAGDYEIGPHEDPFNPMVEQYLEDAGKNVLKLFPCSMSTAYSALRSSYLGHNEGGSGGNYSLFGSLVGQAWSFIKNTAPPGSVNFNYYEVPEKFTEALRILHGIDLTQSLRYRYGLLPAFVNPALDFLSGREGGRVAVLAVGTCERKSANTTSIKYCTWTCGEYSYEDHYLYDGIVADTMPNTPTPSVDSDSLVFVNRIVLSALGVESPTAICNSLSDTRIARWDFGDKSISEVLQSTLWVPDLVSALFELPRKCRLVLDDGIAHSEDNNSKYVYRSATSKRYFGWSSPSYRDEDYHSETEKSYSSGYSFSMEMYIRTGYSHPTDTAPRGEQLVEFTEDSNLECEYFSLSYNTLVESDFAQVMADMIERVSTIVYVLVTSLTYVEGLTYPYDSEKPSREIFRIDESVNKIVGVKVNFYPHKVGDQVLFTSDIPLTDICSIAADKAEIGFDVSYEDVKTGIPLGEFPAPSEEIEETGEGYGYVSKYIRKMATVEAMGSSLLLARVSPRTADQSRDEES